ncbi:hypothetical protein [Nonomuraea sp. NPDC049695]|uniref:hypothetical protein n=1 Tax=Nonomuraea sp. NPDC049695 TaxID=3154734 RepID=UPI00341872DB
MSGLEDAAAAHARRLRSDAESAAARHAEVQRTAEQELARLSKRAREFFVFARDHGARVFRRYDPEEPRANTRLTRTDEVCVVAHAHRMVTGGSWAVTSGGLVYPWAQIHEKRRFLHPMRQGIRDNVFVTADTHDSRYRHGGYIEAHFVAAAAALLAPVPVYPNAPDPVTGVQKDGSIMYLL